MECPFMAATGCSYRGGVCYKIVEKCEGCGRIVEVTSGSYCSACPEPSVKWKIKNCNLATHVATVPTEVKVKMNPLKASKRGV